MLFDLVPLNLNASIASLCRFMKTIQCNVLKANHEILQIYKVIMQLIMHSPLSSQESLVELLKCNYTQKKFRLYSI